MAAMEKTVAWFQALPGWIPIAGSILFGALWVGSQYQSITDRLGALEHQMKDVQQYLRDDRKHSSYDDPESFYNSSHRAQQGDEGKKK